MNLDTLNVKIQADNTDIKKKLGDLKTQLEQTKQKIKDLKQALSDWDSIGVEKTSLAYKDLVKQLEEAEDKQKTLNDLVEEYTRAQEEAADQTDQSSQSMKLMGQSIDSVIQKYFGLYAVIRQAKQALDDFMEHNPTSPLSKEVSDLKDNWSLFKESFIGLFENNAVIDMYTTFFSEGFKEWGLLFQRLTNQHSNLQIETRDIKANIKDISQYATLITKEVVKQKMLLNGFDELNIYVKQQKDTSDYLQAQTQVTAIIKDYREQIKDIDNEIARTWKQAADELGIQPNEYEKLFGLWKNDRKGFFTYLNELEAQYGSSYFDKNQALESMRIFEQEGYPAIQALLNEREKVVTAMNEAVRLLAEIKANLPASINNPNPLVKARAPISEGANHKGTGNYGYTSDIVLYEADFITPYVPNADGGVYTSPTVGLVGEYAGAARNPEIIAPQDMMFETVQQANGMLVDVVAQAAAQVVAAINNKNLEVSIGDDVIASSAARGNTAYYQMTGGYLL